MVTFNLDEKCKYVIHSWANTIVHWIKTKVERLQMSIEWKLI